MAGSMTAGRCGTGEVDESNILTYKERERVSEIERESNLGPGTGF